MTNDNPCFCECHKPPQEEEDLCVDCGKPLTEIGCKRTPKVESEDCKGHYGNAICGYCETTKPTGAAGEVESEDSWEAEWNYEMKRPAVWPNKLKTPTKFKDTHYDVLDPEKVKSFIKQAIESDRKGIVEEIEKMKRQAEHIVDHSSETTTKTSSRAEDWERIIHNQALYSIINLIKGRK